MKVSRSTHTRKEVEASAHALAIARSLRKRDGWELTSVSVLQRWTVDRYRIDSVVSAFLETPRRAGFVFSVNIYPARAKSVLDDGWLQDVQARLGADYATEYLGGQIRLARVLRRTTDPATVLRELQHIVAAVEGKTAVRRTPMRSPPGSARDDVWRILGALSRTRWRVSSIGQEHQRKLLRDRCRWHVSTGLIAIVDSTVKHPGFASTVNCYADTKSTKPRNPISNASALLRNHGYRDLHETHYQHWHRGLTPRAAMRELELLDRAMQLIVTTPG